jgi:hypothetical protein
MPPHVGPGWRHRRHMGALPLHVGPAWRRMGICGCISCSSPFNSLLPRLTRGDGVIEPVVSGWNLLPAMPKKSSSSNGERVVKPKRCRAGQKNAQGTPPKVRVDRVKTELRDEKVLKNMWQTNYETLAHEFKMMCAERDLARAQLKSTEKQSAARLVVIKTEVPDFAASFFKGRFDCYYEASLS